MTNSDGLASITPSEKLPLVYKYAVEITSTYRKSVGSLVETGRKLEKAYGALSTIWGEENTPFGWKLFLFKQCKFSDSTASKLRTIAGNTTIADPANWHLLPNGLEHLYMLAQKHSPADIAQKLKDGKITNSMTVRDIGQLDREPTGRPSSDQYRLTISMAVSEPDRDQLTTDLEQFESDVQPLLKNFPGVKLTSNLSALR